MHLVGDQAGDRNRIAIQHTCAELPRNLVSGQHGANQYAYGAEVGRLLRQNLWLSAGYNFSGFEGDRDLSGYEYTQQGIFLRLRFKFDEDLFRRDEPRYRDPVRHGANHE